MPRSAAVPPASDGDALPRLLRELKLLTLARGLEDLLRESERAQPSYSDLLARALAHELAGRKERRLDRLIAAARLKDAKTVDDFDCSIRPKLSPKLLKELARCAFVDEGRNVLCLGKSSTGKTHIAKALGRNACLLGKRTYFRIAIDVLDELYAAQHDGSFRRVFGRYVRADLVILDELGYAPIDKDRANLLFRLASARHEERRSTVVTSNTTFRRWGPLFPSEAQAVATVERLIDRATILRFTGKGLRGPKEILGDQLDGDDD
jgi:DNA replication protein DnaC